MNVDNIKYAIEVMKKAKNLNMENFQKCGITPSKTIKNLHTCGNTACFIGYMVLTPLWKEFFKNTLGKYYYFSISGSYMRGYCEVYSERSLAMFLGVREELAYDFIYGDIECYRELEADFSKFYGKPFGEVEPEDVIAKLELVLSGELE